MKTADTNRNRGSFSAFMYHILIHPTIQTYDVFDAKKPCSCKSIAAFPVMSSRFRFSPRISLKKWSALSENDEADPSKNWVHDSWHDETHID